MTDNGGANHFDRIAGSVVKGDVKINGGQYIGGSQINNYYNRFVTHIFPPQMPGERTPVYPYVGDRPFRAQEAGIFLGREGPGGPIEQAKERLEEPGCRALIVDGPTGVGKTSFVSAGLLPKLNGAGIQVVTLRSYRHAAQLLQALLHGRAADLGAAIAPGAPAHQQALAITGASQEKLILVLDQCERLFYRDIDGGERQDLFALLRGMLDVVAPSRMQIIATVRTRLRKRLADEWKNHLPGLPHASVSLDLLKAEEAADVIIKPAAGRESRVVWEPAFVKNVLVPQLDALSPKDPGYVLPGDLQIVCDGLYSLATQNLDRDAWAYIIDGNLYRTLTGDKSVTWILDHHFRTHWAQIDPSHLELAKEIAKEIIVREQPQGLQASSLSSVDVSFDDRSAVLEEMAEAGLLSWHLTAGEPAYTFASESTAQSVERRLSSGVRKRREAQAELEFAWYLWENENKLAVPYQLDLLEDYYTNGNLSPDEGLLFLRSAVECRRSVAHWLDQLDTEAALQVIDQLEEERDTTDNESGRQAVNGQLRRLLGLEDPLPARPAGGKFGPVTWAAVAHPRPACRETSILALMSARGEDALSRPAEAVSKAAHGRRRSKDSSPPERIARSRQPAPVNWRWRRRLAELRGMVADARDQLAQRLARHQAASLAGSRPGSPSTLTASLPAIQSKLDELPRLERLEVWSWRFRRRFVRDWDYIGRMFLGGAVGAAFGLSIARLVLALITEPDTGGRYFYSSFPMGFFLGGALTLGLLLVDVIRLRPARRKPKRSGQLSSRGSETEQALWLDNQRPPFLGTFLLGTLGFGLMHLILNHLFGVLDLSDHPQLVPLTLAAGAGLTLAVWDRPWLDRRPGAGGLLARLLAVALVFAAVHLAFIVIEIRTDDVCAYEPGLRFALTSSMYRDLVPQGLRRWGLDSLSSSLVDPVLCPEVKVYYHRIAAIVDFAIVGVALALGMMAGLSRAGKHHLERMLRNDQSGKGEVPSPSAGTLPSTVQTPSSPPAGGEP